MSVRFLHLFPTQLGLNGESGNLHCLVQRLEWAGIPSTVEVFDGAGNIPGGVDAVFIGSGTWAGAMEALEGLEANADALRNLSIAGVPFLSFGLGWEILSQNITALDGSNLKGIGIYPSKSIRTEKRASTECFGYDSSENLTTGYANHSSIIELLDGANPWVKLESGFGNSSTDDARKRSDEGMASENLFAARLNGPLLPMNPHLADEFLGVVAKKSGFGYSQDSQDAAKADGFATNAREELFKRLAR